MESRTELYAERSGFSKGAIAILDKAIAEDRLLTESEQAQVDWHSERLQDMDKRIEDVEQQELRRKKANETSERLA